MVAIASRRQRDGSDLALAGGALGVLAGIVQAAIGSRIPTWTGAKASPGALGLVTVGLSALAAAAALTFERPHTRPGARFAATAIVVVTGLVGFATVGWLWITPSPLLLAGAALSATHTRSR